MKSTKRYFLFGIRPCLEYYKARSVEKMEVSLYDFEGITFEFDTENDEPVLMLEAFKKYDEYVELSRHEYKTLNSKIV